ncbi:unnamed protein product [Periconia digitata]|uniref:Rhodopsin domain-containing protein n=1 Tax=Periconia digitata TaxID=1303443 RepID=A0A9W4XN03_9PLEO|nr:unnamed protein product [Periconia digitata]
MLLFHSCPILHACTMLFYFGSYDIFVGIISLLICLDIVAVVTRVYARRLTRQKLETDDWLVVPVLILNIGMAVSVFIGIGDHALTHRYPTSDVSPEQAAYGKAKQGVLMKIEYALLLMVAAALTLIKLSFLFFYKRVFVYDKTNWKDVRNIIIHALIALIIIWGLGFVLIMLTGCRNHFYAHYSTLEDTMGKCINTFLYLYAFAISDFITDVLIILTPIPFILKLRLSLKRKLGIMLVFLLGALAAITSMMRMIWMKYIMDMTESQMPREFANPIDMPFIVISTEMFWFILEATIALIAACLPTISTIFRTGPVHHFLQNFSSKGSIKSGSTFSGKSRLADWRKTGGQSKHTQVEV